MLAIDLPISVLTGMALADAGRDLLRSGDRAKYEALRNTVLLFAVFFITPIPFYFFLGWPAWETNFLWKWPDNLLDSPARAGVVAFGVFLLTVGPAYLGLRLGALLIRRGHDRWVKIGCGALLALVGVIILATRDITFNIASTQEKYVAQDFYSFWSNPFFLGWLLVSLYFWISLGVAYRMIRKGGLTWSVPLAAPFGHQA